MWIKLISPRVTMRPMDSAFKRQMSPPLSLLVLGALTPDRHRVTIADENIERLRLDDRPDLVGITVKADTADRSREIARSYRQRGSRSFSAEYTRPPARRRLPTPPTPALSEKRRSCGASCFATPKRAR